MRDGREFLAEHAVDGRAQMRGVGIGQNAAKFAFDFKSCLARGAPEKTLMYLFGNAGGPVFPDELSVYLAHTPANVTRIADLLVRRGLVARTNSTADRRRVELRITPAGREFVLRLLPQFFPPLRAAFSCFSAEDKQQLQRLLRQLVESLDTVIDS